MKISVIMPCYNAEDTLEIQLNALAAQSWESPWDIIFVDNNSSDFSLKIAKAYSDRLPNLRIIQAKEKQGAAYALNEGIKASNSEAIVFCDADDMVGDGWLYAMGTALLRYDFVACKMEVDRLNQQLPKGHGFGNPQKAGLQQIWYPPYLPHAGCGTSGIKKKLHNEIGGFDESMPYLFDTDYCFKVQLMTKSKLYFVPDATMHVRYRQSFSDTYKQSKGYAKYNVFLSRRYQFFSEPNPCRWKIYFKDWHSLMTLILKFRIYKDRYKIAWQLGRQIGRSVGFIKYRVPPV
jgi:glycosyltransferase involved in cell wall biosynthesis